MHELSIATSLVEIARAEIARVGHPPIYAVHVRLGPLCGLEPKALEFSFALAIDQTPLAGARLVIEKIPIVAHCTTCDAERTIPSAQSLRCPVCAEPASHIIHGRELELTALEVGESPNHVAPHR